MAFYTYDEEADALYVLLALEAEGVIERTIDLGERLHVDVDANGRPVGVEILYPTQGVVDLESLLANFGVQLRLPFSFEA